MGFNINEYNDRKNILGEPGLQLGTGFLTMGGNVRNDQQEKKKGFEIT